MFPIRMKLNSRYFVIHFKKLLMAFKLAQLRLLMRSGTRKQNTTANNFRRPGPTENNYLNFADGKILESMPTFNLFSLSIFLQLCSSKLLVRTVSRLLKYESFLIRPLHFFIRRAIFPKFAREDLVSCLETSKYLYSSAAIKSIVDFSTEDQVTEIAWAFNLKSKLQILEQFNSSQNEVQYMPLKCTSLMCPSLLERITRRIIECKVSSSDHDILNSLDKNDKKLFQDAIIRLNQICIKAKNSNIRLLLDAEQTFRQPAIELIARLLSQEFNKELTGPVIYNTYQMYLKRTKAVLLRDIKAAEESNYTFAAKIVRGAYMDSERNLATLDGADDPVLSSKAATDACYDETVSYLLSQISAKQPYTDRRSCGGISVMIATHNRKSIESAVCRMEALNMSRNDDRVHFAQILGISDHCTNSLGLAGYNVSKLIPFGPYSELLPWLLRRLDENQDALGAMQQDRHIFTGELQRRLRFRS